MIYVRQSAYEDMLAHARACTEEMACGILSGRIEGGKRMAIGLGHGSHEKTGGLYDRHLVLPPGFRGPHDGL